MKNTKRTTRKGTESLGRTIRKGAESLGRTTRKGKGAESLGRTTRKGKGTESLGRTTRKGAESLGRTTRKGAESLGQTTQKGAESLGRTTRKDTERLGRTTRKDTESLGCSSPQQKKQKGQFDASLFNDQDCYDWYVNRKKDGIVKERTFAGDIQATLEINSLFSRLGWNVILNLKGAYYPDLMGMFFANMDDKVERDKLDIVTTVKGVKIVLDVYKLAEILGMVIGDTQILCDPKAKVPIEATYSEEEAKDRIKGNFFQSVFKSSSFASRLEAKERVLLHFISHNIAPRVGDLCTIRSIDWYFLDKIVNGQGDLSCISLCHTVIQSMREVVRKNKNMCFPIILSKIFAAFHVDLENETVASTNINDVYDKDSLKRMGFLMKNGVWVKKGNANHDDIHEDGETGHFNHSQQPGPHDTQANLSAPAPLASSIDDVLKLQHILMGQSKKLLRQQQAILDHLKIHVLDSSDDD